MNPPPVKPSSSLARLAWWLWLPACTLMPLLLGFLKPGPLLWTACGLNAALLAASSVALARLDDEAQPLHGLLRALGLAGGGSMAACSIYFYGCLSFP